MKAQSERGERKSDRERLFAFRVLLATLANQIKENSHQTTGEACTR